MLQPHVWCLLAQHVPIHRRISPTPSTSFNIQRECRQRKADEIGWAAFSTKIAHLTFVKHVCAQADAYNL